MKKENFNTKLLKQNKLFIITLTLLLAGTAFAQNNKDDDRIYWSEGQKLTISDFGIHTRNMESGATSAEFAIDYQVSKLNFATKSFNKKVRNYMVKSTSQIDVTGNVDQFLLYQQTLFDLSEVYAREFRRALQQNKKLLIQSTSVADELNWKIMSEFMERRAKYTKETNSASNKVMQKKWQKEIAYELSVLKDYAYDSK